MAIIERALALQHVKSDAEDVEDPLVDFYIEAAGSICEGYCNRHFYEDDAARYLAFDEGLVKLAEARDTRDAALDIHTACDIRDAIANRYIEEQGAALKMVNGCVADGNIKAAILMTFGFLYRQRPDVPAVPTHAMRILQPYLWIGNLVGGS